MTTREIERTVEKTETETIAVCDACGLGRDADGRGEMMKFTNISSKPVHLHERCRDEWHGDHDVRTKADTLETDEWGRPLLMLTTESVKLSIVSLLCGLVAILCWEIGGFLLAMEDLGLLVAIVGDLLLAACFFVGVAAVFFGLAWLLLAIVGLRASMHEADYT